jgi:hypothetical protein
MSTPIFLKQDISLFRHQGDSFTSLFLINRQIEIIGHTLVKKTARHEGKKI